MSTPDRERAPVFVVSTGRAGSKMLARVLAPLPGVLALHEPQPHLLTEAYLHWKGALSVEDVESALQKKRGDLVEQVSLNGLIYVESSHYCSHLIPELSRLFGARFVFLHRDPRGFTESGLGRSWWYPRFSLAESIRAFARRRLRLDVGVPWHDHRLDPPREYRTRMERIAWLWVEINRVILRDLDSVPDGSRFEFRLEDAGPERFEQLLEFIGCEYRPSHVDTMAATARRKPNRGERSAGELPWDEQRFREITGPLARQLGYEEPGRMV